MTITLSLTRRNHRDPKESAPSSESRSKDNEALCAFDGHAALLCDESGVARLLGVDDACLATERFRQPKLPVHDVRDFTHGLDVVGLVHDLADLNHGEIRHQLGAPRLSLLHRFV